MAYTFNGTSQYLRKDGFGTAIGTYPITVFVRGNAANTTNSHLVATYVRTQTTFNGLHNFLASTAKAQAHTTNSSNSYAANVWSGITGISSGATAHDVNLDDTVTSGTSSVTFEGYDSIQVGARNTSASAFTNYMNGSACSVAMWDVALSAAECKSLNAGFSPRRVRPQSLKVYAPLIRSLQVLVNAVTTGDFTAVNSPTVSAHPRSYGI